MVHDNTVANCKTQISSDDSSDRSDGDIQNTNTIQDSNENEQSLAHVH